MREPEYQKKVINKIKAMFPGSKALKNDSAYIQGIPDWTVFYKDKYAILEIKISKDAVHQPNQDYYVEEFNKDSFGRFLYPENEIEVLNDLSKHFNNK